MAEAEPARTLLPYLQRADELQKHDPLVAYYCRLFAVEKGLKIPKEQRTATTNGLLKSIVAQLEKDKKNVKLNEQEDPLHVEGFALNVFNKADKQDRAGKADLNTAKTFYAASIFFEVLRQFGELQFDVAEKQKYAVWKAADIRAALRDGKKPTPGPPVGEQEPEEPPPQDGQPPGPPGATLSQTSSFGFNPPPPPQHPQLGQPPSFSTYAHPPPADQPSAPPPALDEYGFPAAPTKRPSVSLQPPPGMPGYPPLAPSQPQPPPPEQPPFHPPPHDGLPPSSSYPDPATTSYGPPGGAMYGGGGYPIGGSLSSQSSGAYELPPRRESDPRPPPTAPPFAPSAPQGNGYSGAYSNVPYQPTQPSTQPVAPMPVPVPGFHPDANAVAEAHKYSRFTVSALAFDDVPTAVRYLQQALALLTMPNPPIDRK